MTECFYTMNGQMMAYDSGGVTKDFLTDHLGSITAEIDQTQTRTYDTRYSAYGRNIWSTGTGCGFGWVGSYGYRETGLFKMSHYVRARHYSYVTGGWSTVDPLWPYESAYGYVGGRVARFKDPLGKSACQRGKPNDCSKLGTSPEAICIATLCSMEAAHGLISSIIGGVEDTGDISKDLLNWIKEQLIDAGKGGFQDPRDNSPMDCCKEAKSGNKVGAIPSVKAQIIGIICKKLKGKANCAISSKSLKDCCSCCTKTFPKPNAFQLGCQFLCEKKHNEDGGCT